MSDIQTPEQPKPLTLDMIKPTESNLIPENGIFPRQDTYLGELFQKFSENLHNKKERQNFLAYITKIGSQSDIEKYLGIVNEDIRRSFSPKEQLQEMEMLADGYMNAAEAARRRNDYWKNKNQTPTEDPLKLLQQSLEYREKAEKLRRQIKEADQR